MTLPCFPDATLCSRPPPCATTMPPGGSLNSDMPGSYTCPRPPGGAAEYEEIISWPAGSTPPAGTYTVSVSWAPWRAPGTSLQWLSSGRCLAGDGRQAGRQQKDEHPAAPKEAPRASHVPPITFPSLLRFSTTAASAPATRPRCPSPSRPRAAAPRWDPGCAACQVAGPQLPPLAVR